MKSLYIFMYCFVQALRPNVLCITTGWTMSLPPAFVWIFTTVYLFICWYINILFKSRSQNDTSMLFCCKIEHCSMINYRTPAPETSTLWSQFWGHRINSEWFNMCELLSIKMEARLPWRALRQRYLYVQQMICYVHLAKVCFKSTCIQKGKKSNN